MLLYPLINLNDKKFWNHMGLMRKTCLQGLLTTEAQTSLCSLISAFVIWLLVSYQNLQQVKYHYSI